ncbi:MAG: isochorismate synthase [Desulfobacterales bacterium]|nr:isochorismate synthase [Desulfobacterales bacterium]
MKISGKTFNFDELFKDELNDLRIENKYIRIEKQIDINYDILDLIFGYNVKEQFYFKDKNNSYEIAGLGNILTIKSSSQHEISKELKKLWNIDDNLCVFGGVSFFLDKIKSAEWKRFNCFRFTIPFIEIRKEENITKLIINFYNHNNLKALDVVKEISYKLKSIDNALTTNADIIPNKICNELLIPNQKQWENIIYKALTKINEKEISKIVLSRKKVLVGKNTWNPLLILNKISTIKENSFIFFYKISDENIFLGRSPERLISIKNNFLTAESIAGTRPRGKTDEEDHALEIELLNSKKEREEQRIVSRYIEGQMAKFCKNFNTEILEEILKLENIQHVITKYKGELDTNNNFLEILLSFHPTPAVGGNPSKRAQELIREYEPFERGWYAAPIGWMKKNEADFAVGIRSALIHKHELHIFGGAGVIHESDPYNEWKEIEYKMSNYSVSDEVN